MAARKRPGLPDSDGVIFITKDSRKESLFLIRKSQSAIRYALSKDAIKSITHLAIAGNITNAIKQGFRWIMTDGKISDHASMRDVIFQQNHCNIAKSTTGDSSMACVWMTRLNIVRYVLSRDVVSQVPQEDFVVPITREKEKGKTWMRQSVLQDSRKVKSGLIYEDMWRSRPQDVCLKTVRGGFLSIVMSWRITLDDLLKAVKRSTTSTETRQTTDLRTLSFGIKDTLLASALLTRSNGLSNS